MLLAVKTGLSTTGCNNAGSIFTHLLSNEKQPPLNSDLSIAV